MNTNLNEAFIVSKRYDKKGNPIAYVDPNKPENKDTFKYKDVFKNHGAKWDNENRYWFWYIGKTKDQWQNVYTKFIEPALKAVHSQEGATEEQSKESLIASLDAVIGEVQAAPTTGGEDGLTPDDKKNVVDRLAKFKETLVNLDNDEEFKKTMQILTAFKNAQGHSYSFTNTILIWIQNPNAKLVKSEINWHKFNRTIVDKSKKMWVRSPSRSALQKYSKEQEQQIINKFLQSVNKKTYGELTAGEKERLGVILRGRMVKPQFEFTPVYDVTNTAQIEGKENLLGDYEKHNEIKWFEENMLSDEVRPVYNALMEFAKENGIEVNIVDDLGGARGSSASGKIELLKSEGNDVGITKTLAHEITHELLHQTYLKQKGSKYAQYFIGTSQGRDLVEQQAELSAWMVLASYGFNLKTTSLNYAAIWGADKEAMIRVFDTVTGVVNMLLDYINEHMSNNPIKSTEPTEEPAEMSEAVAPSIKQARHVTPMDVAKILGVTSEYEQILNQSKEKMMENFNRLIKKSIL